VQNDKEHREVRRITRHILRGECDQRAIDVSWRHDPFRHIRGLGAATIPSHKVEISNWGPRNVVARF
jgi:hypothetical protein